MAAPAHAQPADPSTERDDLSNLSLEALLEVKVSAASRFVQDLSHAPASVSIVDAEEIRRHGYRTIADILRNVRGFYITYDRNYRYVGVRGFSRPGDFNSRVLLLLNGLRLNDTIFEQALLGTESPIDVALIDRVEIVRGPSSSLYGTSAFLGVINIITRQGRALERGEAEIYAGTQSLLSGRATIGGRTASGREGLFSVSGFDTTGQTRLYFPVYEVPGVSDGIARHVDDDRGGRVYGQARLGALEVQGGFSSRTKTIPTGAYNTVFNDDRTQTTDRRGFVDAAYRRQISPRTHLQARASYNHFGYDGRFAYEEGLFTDGARADWLIGDLSIAHQFNRHGLTVGTEYRDNLRQHQYASDQIGSLLDDRRNMEVAALFVEDELRLGSKVLLNTGARWDHYFDTFGGTLNPRVGLIVLPRQGTAIKALYGRAFRAPNPFELYYDQSLLSTALQPERIATYELVLEQRLAPAFHVTSSVFEYRAKDLIAQRSGADTVDGLYYQNVDTASARGVEFEAQAELPSRLRIRASQVFQSVTDTRTGVRLSNSPTALSNLVVNVPIARTGLFAGVNGLFVSSRDTVAGDRVPRALVTDLTLSRPVTGRGLAVTLAIGNLFNASYADPGSREHLEQSIPQDGRTAWLRATWRF